MELRVLLPPCLTLIVGKNRLGGCDVKKSKEGGLRKRWDKKDVDKRRSCRSTNGEETYGKDCEEEDGSDKVLSATEEEEEVETEFVKSSSDSSQDSGQFGQRNDKKIGGGIDKGDGGTTEGPLNISNNNSSKCEFRLVAKERIERGVVLYPNQGVVQVFSPKQPFQPLPPEHVLQSYGLIEEVVSSDLHPGEVRLCNWIRFIRMTKPVSSTEGDPDDPCPPERGNIIGRPKGDEGGIITEFEIVERIEPGTELLLVDTRSGRKGSSTKLRWSSSVSGKPGFYPGVFSQIDHFNQLIRIKRELNPSADGPLDLSKCPLKGPVKTEPPFENREEADVCCPIVGDPFLKSHLFSISQVLRKSPEPFKIFQPYSLTSSLQKPVAQKPKSHGDDTSSSKFPNDYYFSPRKDDTRVISSSLATPTSLRSSSESPRSPGVGPMSPRSPGVRPRSSGITGPVLIRPILRTRGRERSLLPCEVCGKAFDRPSLLKRHMRTHTGEKPHICDVCSKGFSTSSSLNTHRRIHSGEKPHQCPICGKRFTASSNLYYHRMTHNKEKPHKCVLCGKSFPTPGDLKSHQYVHSGSWPYNCPVCHRGFSKQTNLRNHLLLHSGDRPHNCHICGKKFALACNLRAHLRTHEEEPISSCLSCKRSFLSSLNMLVNGYCRPCLLVTSSAATPSTASISTPMGSSSSTLGSGSGSKIPSAEVLPRISVGGTRGRTGTPPPPSSASVTSITSGLYPGGFTVPTSGLFQGGMGIGGPTNPFLEQLFEWNYRFAKETAGNLNIMQQKLLESQMLAAQLMIGSSATPTHFALAGLGVGGMAELLRIRPSSHTHPDFTSSGGNNNNNTPGGLDLNKFI